MSEDSDKADKRNREHPIREEMTHQLKVWRYRRRIVIAQTPLGMGFTTGRW